MPADVLLAIDQGTTNTKAILVNACGQILSRASCSPQISYPQPGWVEQDPSRIWETVAEAIADCLRQVDYPALAGVSVTNQRETVLAWEKSTGKPLGPAIVWQCHRTVPFCQALRERGLEGPIRQRTGLTIDPMFSGSKMRWLLDHLDDGYARAERGEIQLGTVDSWILWNLTGRHATDLTNASRTQLLNLQTREWDETLLGWFGVPRAALPEIKRSDAVFGETLAVAGLSAGIPVAGVLGDSHAALFGHAGFRPGSVKATYGTGSSLMTPTASPVFSQSGLSTTIAWGREETTYALEGNIYSTGAAVKWLGQVLGLEDPGNGVEALASQVSDSAGVAFVPAFVGLGAPHWNERARGLVTGITAGTTAPHLARATLEAIAFQVRDVFDVMSAEAGAPLDCLLADGGASRNDLLMQLQADVLGVPVVRNLSTDLSALGAAFLGGLALGLWASPQELVSLPRSEDRFEPRISAEQRSERYATWRAAVRRVLFETT
jgi:glycerol kinase